MKNLPTYSLVIVALLLNLGFIFIKLLEQWLPQYALLSKNWFPWLFVLNGLLINVVLLYLLYREISKVREHLNIPGLNRPNRTPFQPGFSPIEEQIKISVSDSLKNESTNKSDKLLDSIQKKIGRIETAIGSKSHQENLSDSVQNPNLQDTLVKIDGKLERCIYQIQNLSKAYQFDFQSLEGRIKHLEIYSQGIVPSNASDHPLENWKSVEQPDHFTHEFTQQDVHNLVTSPQLQEIIDRFNSQRPELFNDFSATLLALTSDSSQGKVDINNRRILQLEIPIDNSQATYLKFDLDNKTWLIPNIKSSYITRIMLNLSENPEIFSISSSSNSGSLKLIKPAQLKQISSGLWEIEEPGEFQG